jgi:hypothetical protein
VGPSYYPQPQAVRWFQPLEAREASYWFQSRRQGEEGGWSYYPPQPEAPPFRKSGVREEQDFQPLPGAERYRMQAAGAAGSCYPPKREAEPFQKQAVRLQRKERWFRYYSQPEVEFHLPR